MVAAIAIGTKAQKILANVGFPWAFHTARDAVGEVKPGFICTSTALTAHTYDVELPDAANDIAAGIALRNPEHDIDTAYTQWDEFELALVGGGHLVWCQLHTNSVGKFGTKLEATVAGAGSVVSMTEANVIEQCGITYLETATYANTQPTLMILTPG